MSERHPVGVWPATPATPFSDLWPVVEGVLPRHELHVLGGIDDLGEAIDRHELAALVLVVDTSFTERELPALTNLGTSLAPFPDVSVVAVVGDGYLGTDIGSRPSTAAGAIAVSAVRSLGLQRRRPGRSNAICVPQSCFDESSQLRGPIAQPTQTWDVAQAVAFLLGDTGRYISGDVLYLNGGRHLFSSHTA